MNLREKLQGCRVELQKKQLKKTGKNKFSNFDYFELSDFLPEINELMGTYKLSSQFTIEGGNCCLSIFDSEKDEKIDFTIPLVSIEMKGSNPIQNLGAVITYSRRYLYMIAFEIIEADVVDDKPQENIPKKTYVNDVKNHFELKPELVNEFTSLIKLIKNADSVDILNIESTKNNIKSGKIQNEKLLQIISFLKNKYFAKRIDDAIDKIDDILDEFIEDENIPF